MTEKTNIPQGYKVSPLGMIPKEWEVKRLGEFAPLQRGYDLPTDKIVRGEYPVVYSNGILNYHYEYKAKGPGVVTGRSGTIGKVTFVESNYWPHNTSLWVTDFKGNNPKYVFHLYSYINLSKFASGSGVPTLNRNDVHASKFAIPPIHEQDKIVEVLDFWDTSIEKQSELIEKLKLRKRALMQQLLTGKKRLPEFSGEWKKRTYSSILTEVKRSLKWDENELYKLISVRRRSEGLFFRESLYGRDIATKNLRPAKTGDFLISKMQIVHGASGLVTDEFDEAKISGSYISLVSKDSNILDIRYYNFWSQMPIFYHQTFVSSFGVHIEKMTFDLDTFMSFGMPLPPIEEQHAIVSLIESVNKEIKLANEKLTNYQSQKRGLMQQLLTGKKRIK